MKVVACVCRGWYKLEDGNIYAWGHYDNILGCLVRISDGKEFAITNIDYDEDDEALAFYFQECNGREIIGQVIYPDRGNVKL